MNSEPLVSILILNWDGLDETEQCLSSLGTIAYKNVEILVLDNGSKRREDIVLKKKYSNINYTFFRSNLNLGYTGGNNFLIKKSKGDYVILLNNDTRVTKYWINELVKVVESDLQIAVVQPKLRSLKEPSRFDYAGAAGGYIDIFGFPFTRGRLFETMEKDKGQYDQIVEIFWASGAAIFIRKNVLKRVGYLDERFFNYMEEIDICWKMRRLGYKIVSQPKSIVYHKVAASSGRNLFKKRYLEHRNNLLLLIENYSVFEFLLLFPTRLLLELVGILYYLTTKKFTYAKAASLSFIYILVYLPKLLLRKKISLNSFLLKDNRVYKGSIVLQYFILGKKTFYSIFHKREIN